MGEREKKMSHCRTPRRRPVTEAFNQRDKDHNSAFISGFKGMSKKVPENFWNFQNITNDSCLAKIAGKDNPVQFRGAISE
jgi:hypothetical protein